MYVFLIAAFKIDLRTFLDKILFSSKALWISVDLYGVFFAGGLELIHYNACKIKYTFEYVLRE